MTLGLTPPQSSYFSSSENMHERSKHLIVFNSWAYSKVSSIILDQTNGLSNVFYINFPNLPVTVTSSPSLDSNSRGKGDAIVRGAGDDPSNQHHRAQGSWWSLLWCCPSPTHTVEGPAPLEEKNEGWREGTRYKSFSFGWLVVGDDLFWFLMTSLF